MPPRGFKNLAELWQAAVARYGRKTAFIYDGQSRSYAAAEADAAALAATLRNEAGFREGDRLAVAMGNCYEYAVAYWACMRLGGVIVPINTRLTGREMKSM